jgi:hypothetical protein
LKLPRDVSGEELVRSLRRFGYEVTRQTGSHMRIPSKFQRYGTSRYDPGPSTTQSRNASEILGDVASYLDLTREQLTQQLFG